MNNHIISRPINILMIEDSSTDVLLMREALEGASVPKFLHVVDDGVQAMELLRREGKHSEAPRPDLILLDLNMPRKNGHEVLSEIKTDESFKSIPVIILTTSKAESDITKAYGQHANGYITKPVDFAGFAEVVRSIESFWFYVITLPTPQNCAEAIV
jgi:chemotaxis family two-component system response regulator Rcp1